MDAALGMLCQSLAICSSGRMLGLVWMAWLLHLICTYLWWFWSTVRMVSHGCACVMELHRVCMGRVH